MEHTRRAFRFLEDGVESFEMKAPKAQVQTTPIAAKNVDVLTSKVYEEVTTLDGQLKRIDWDERSPRFVIVDPLTKLRIRCKFKASDLEKALAAFPHRVEVHGTAKYNIFGHPVSIEVDHFSQIPGDDALPSLEDLRQVNITNGMDPGEFVRALRDGD